MSNNAMDQILPQDVGMDYRQLYPLIKQNMLCPFLSVNQVLLILDCARLGTGCSSINEHQKKLSECKMWAYSNLAHHFSESKNMNFLDVTRYLLLDLGIEEFLIACFIRYTCETSNIVLMMLFLNDKRIEGFLSGLHDKIDEQTGLSRSGIICRAIDTIFQYGASIGHLELVSLCLGKFVMQAGFLLSARDKVLLKQEQLRCSHQNVLWQDCDRIRVLIDQKLPLHLRRKRTASCSSFFHSEA